MGLLEGADSDGGWEAGCPQAGQKLAVSNISLPHLAHWGIRLSLAGRNSYPVLLIKFVYPRCWRCYQLWEKMAKIIGEQQACSPGDGEEEKMALILTDFHDYIGTITFNHDSKRNALSRALIHELIQALNDLIYQGARVRGFLCLA